MAKKRCRNKIKNRNKEQEKIGNPKPEEPNETYLKWLRGEPVIARDIGIKVDMNHPLLKRERKE